MSETKGAKGAMEEMGVIETRQNAASVLERKISRLKKDVEELEALKAFADTLEVGSVVERALWKMISVVI